MKNLNILKGKGKGGGRVKGKGDPIHKFLSRLLVKHMKIWCF